MTFINKNCFEAAVLTCAEMTACDKWTIAHRYHTGIELMENAGAAISDVVLRDYVSATKIHVLCGPGNNGGDGYVVARLLAERGVDVRLYALDSPRTDTDAAMAAKKWMGATLHFDNLEPNDNDLVVDAVFGSGFTGELPDKVQTAIRKIMTASCAVVAVDLPSGLSGDTGLGDAMAADVTVTFFRKKPGHLTGRGPALCGALHVADIGVQADFYGEHDPHIYENTPSFWGEEWPDTPRHTHKYQRGHVAVFSGPKYQTGAARLSAAAAARAGAGAVTILGQADALDVHAAHVTSIMLKECAKGEAVATLDTLTACRCVVLGPGFGDLKEARWVALDVLSNLKNRLLVLDADGITAFANAPQDLFDAASRKDQVSLVLTPHEGEFARLFPDLAADDTLGKLQKAQKAAQRAHAVVVYKGADTVIACPVSAQMANACAAININGTPALATAGSGDVLAGIIAGLMAQGMDPFYAACAAVWLHGEAGKQAGPVCIAEDLIDSLQTVVPRMLHAQ